ncbi:unnamed protein product [Penicillium salamii]|uniref:Uncharacterized protein n=1 Tax=Penicillium salamii TaxID=1612424 RepID=A0A9W4JSL8_9EURO|nr:unnamed protein product [Penicillium salamii]
MKHARKRRSYNSTSVLIFHWENDNLNIITGENRLVDIFCRVYDFQVETFTIPLVDSQFALLLHLRTWFDNNQGKNVLKIIVYSGHARNAGTTAFRWELAGRTDRHGALQGPRLSWWAVREFLREFAGDTCYIFDYELLVSRGSNAIASSSDSWPFSKALVDTLRDLDGRPATLAQIYTKLSHWAQQTQAVSCPIHVLKLGKPSITIARAGVPNASLSSDDNKL